MSLRQRIYEMLCLANSDNRNFPATIFYNEGWLLRLALDWFSRQAVDNHPLSFEPGSRWFSEALLPSQFLARQRSDSLAEGWTHADGVIGHVTIGSGALANATLMDGATQLIITEAKLFSPLSPGVTHARDFDQAARNVACIAEVLCRGKRPPGHLSSLGFFVIAPSEQIERKRVFGSLLTEASINDKVRRRVAGYADSGDGQQKDQWLREWFEPTLARIQIKALAWEEIVQFICAKDVAFGEGLSLFYKECCKFNRVQEPE
jgi:hypothetical protein